jgi:glutathione synthase
MRRLKIGFLIDPVSRIHPAYDTSFALMTECKRRGHSIFCCELSDLRAHHNTVEGRMTKSAPDAVRGLLPEGSSAWMDLSRLDAFFIRKDPPFDMAYVSALYLLDALRGKLLMVNDPRGILMTNEKLSILPFLPFCPPSIAGSQPAAFEDFLKRPSKNGWIFKQLFYKGGRGIVWLKLSQISKMPNLVRRLTRNGREPVLCQHYIDHRKTGDKRILILNGKILGAMTRLARAGEFRANLSRGAVAAAAKVTSREKALVKRLFPYLRSRGLIFTGIDVLSGYLSEINVTSPSGAPEINAFNHTKVEAKILDFVEQKRIKYSSK